jgi:hypothetical protein
MGRKQCWEYPPIDQVNRAKPDERAWTGTWRSGALVWISCFLTSACAASTEPRAQVSGALIYGADDRVNFYDATSPIARTRVSESMVAFIPNAMIDPRNQLSPAVRTWSQLDDLCPGEPFADEPSAAFCSGVLVDWDLVLTAGHCVRLFALRDFSIRFGYYYSSPGTLARSEVFRPVGIVSERLDPPAQDPRLDYAWVRLDRAAAPPRRPAPMSLLTSSLQVGDGIVSIGAGGGVPILIDEGATITQLRPESQDYFVTDSDTSHGSSGGAAFTEGGVLLGILARGGADFMRTEQGCATTVHAESTRADEQYTYAAAAVAGLCETDSSVASVCRPDCGEPCQARSTRVSATGCSVAGKANVPQSSGAAGFGLLLLGCVSRRFCRRPRKTLPRDYEVAMQSRTDLSCPRSLLR